MRLYHYTCRTAAKGIGRYGMIRTWGHVHFQIGDGFPVVWLTDLEVPDPVALGLHNRRRLVHLDRTECNRMEVRYVVETNEAVPWTEWAEAHHVPLDVRKILEDGRAPEHWFVAETAQHGIMDRMYRPPAEVAR